MLRSFFKQQRRKRDEEHPGPTQSNIQTPSRLGDGLTRPRSTPISPYLSTTLGSLRAGSMSTPEVNSANAVAIMTGGHRRVSQDLSLFRAIINHPSRSGSTAREIPDRRGGESPYHGTSNPQSTSTSSSSLPGATLPFVETSAGTPHSNRYLESNAVFPLATEPIDSLSISHLMLPHIQESPVDPSSAMTRAIESQTLELATTIPDQGIGPGMNQDTSATGPLMLVSSTNSTSNAGRDIGSKNVVQRGDGTNIAIGDSNQVHIHPAPNEDLHKTLLSRITDKLGSYIVKDAVLTKDIHGEPSLCYEGTRTRLLDSILSWAQADHATYPENAIDVSNHTFCIEGAPGSGKSTIMNTMVIELLDEAQRQQPGLVTAHYMIRRRLHTTTDASKVLPTLVYQLASRSPEAAQKIALALDSIPQTGVLSRARTNQLFLEAIEASHGKTLIIVDALDESSEPEVLGNILSPIIHHPPLSLRLLLATRSEYGILRSLGDDIIPKIVRSIPTKDSYDEVGRVIACRLIDGVKVLFGCSPRWANWPSVSQINDLTKRADGLYIWATTAVDFILSQVKRRGSIDRDRWIEEVGRVGQGTKTVDALYSFILRNYIQEYEENERHIVVDHMKDVLGFIVTAEHPLALDDMIAFLDINSFDVHHFVEVIRSILVSGTEPIIGSTAPQVHRTFSDFITRDRAAQLQVELQDLHRIATDRCFSLMETRLRFNICGLQSSFDLNEDGLVASVPKGLVYASTSWEYHLSKTNSQHRHSSLRSIQTFLHENFLFWLEIVSVAQKDSSAPYWVSRLGSMLKETCPTAEASDVNLAELARDASRLLDGFQKCIRESIPHIYISLLAFSPRDSIVAAYYRKRVASMVLPHPPDIPLLWDSWENDSRMVARHEHPWSISFSPSGHHLAAGYNSGSVQVWDVETGECILGPLMGHKELVFSVCFSPNGLLLATGSWDLTVRVWDSKTGHCVLGPLAGHTGFVFSVSFSPDSTRIASGADDQSIRVWDALTGECVLGPLTGHSDRVRCVSYSPNGSYIASCFNDGSLRLWDAQSGQCVLDVDLLQGQYAAVFSICFSPDGGRLVSASRDGTLRIWETQTWTCVHGPLAGHTDLVYCVCVSPDGQYIASGSRDCTIRIWDAEKAECVVGPIRGATDALYAIAFSPNNKYLAAGCGDGTVRLWDFNSLLRNATCKGDDGADAGNTSTIRDHTAVDDKGWTLGPQGQRLFWGPEPFNSAIWRPSTIRILGRPAMIKPDLSNLVTGEEWLQCFPV